MIPKIIHYCWLSSEPVPPEMQSFVDSWKKKLVGYQFVCWNFKIFPKESVPWVSEAFDQKKYAFAADYIRLYALYKMGGIYMDMDVEVLKPFDDLLHKKRLLGFEQANCIEAGIMGSEQGAKWVSECLKYYEGRHFSSNSAADTIPLPRIVNQVLTSLGDDMSDLLPPVFLTAKSPIDGKIRATENTYTIHHFSGSWLTPWQKLKAKVKPLFYSIGMYSFIKKIIKRFGL